MFFKSQKMDYAEIAVDLVDNITVKAGGAVEVAKAAAAHSEARCQVISMEIKDKVNQEITLGHAVVIVAYGSEFACDSMKKMLFDAIR